MTLLEVFFIISAFIIFIIGFDIARKQRFNFLHIFIFLGISFAIIVFTFSPSLLNNFGHIFGVQRGADVLVYMSILFLIYFVLFLFNKSEQNRKNLTELIREIAILNSKKEKIKVDTIILVRSFNEGEVLEETLKNIIDGGYKNILLIDDGSKDNTGKIVEKFEENIIYLKHMKNRGAGAALETGFEYARRFIDFKYLVSFDADGQHDIKDLSKFITKFEKNQNLKVIFGSRFIKKTKTNIPFFRKIILFLGKYFTFFISGIFLTDTHNGYRVFKKSAIDKIYLTIDGMAYASELIDNVKRKNLEFSEVPVNIKYTEYSLKKGQKNSNAIKIALSMINKKFFE